MMRLLVFMLCCLVVVMSSFSRSHAASADSLYVFGDSSSDNGNLLTYLVNITGEDPSILPQFTDGRLSNGPNWVDYVANAMNKEASASLQGGTNYAWAAALMGRGQVEIVVPPSWGLPPLYAQNTGQVIYDYTTAGGSFAGQDVVFLFSGHNNALTIYTNGVLSDPVKVAQELGDNLEMINAGGGRVIVVPTLLALDNAPDIVKAGLSGVVKEWIATYESNVNIVIARFLQNNPNAVVIRPDVGKVIQAVMENPSRFGISNVKDRAFNETTQSAVSNPNDYLWWDVHVTTLIQRLIAQEVLGALGDYFCPQQMLPQAAASTLQLNRTQAQNALGRGAKRLRRLHRTQGAGKGLAAGTPVNEDDTVLAYAIPHYTWGRQFSSDKLAAAFNWNSTGLDVGLMGLFGDYVTAGLTVDMQKIYSEGESDTGEARISDLGLHPYVQFTYANVYLNLGGRLSWQENRAWRPISLTASTAKADFHSKTWGARTELGYHWQATDYLRVTPFAGLDWTRVEGSRVDETEAGIMNTTLELESYNSFRHLLGLEMAATFALSESATLNLSINGGWRHEYKDTSTRAHSTLAITTRTLEGASTGRDALDTGASVGLSLPYGTSLAVDYSCAYARRQLQQSVAFQMGIKF